MQFSELENYIYNDLKEKINPHDKIIVKTSNS